MKIAINKCYGGFGLSEQAYEKLIEWGVPVKKYVDQEQDPETGLWKPQPLNEGEVIFDRSLGDESDKLSTSMRCLAGRYWDDWTRQNRAHPLVIRAIEELGEAANGRCSKLAVVEIPDDVEWEIDEYDGFEHIAEKHRTWG